MSAAVSTAGRSGAPYDYFATGWTGGRSRAAIAAVATFGTFMELLDSSIANVSLPTIAGSLSVSQDQTTWVLTSYLASNAVVLPISGWLSSRFGRKRFYMTCIVLFTLTSLLCGVAPSLGALVFFRVLQGAAGGGLPSTQAAILADTFPPAKLGVAMAAVVLVAVLAPAIGPTLGGYITDHANWRWVFFINIPVGVVSFIASGRVISDPPHLRQARERAKKVGVDWVGLALVAVGLAFLEVVLDKGQEEDWLHSSFIVTSLIISVVSLASFLAWEWRHPSPVVSVRMFRQRSFAAANALMFVTGGLLYATTLLLPQYLQVLMGYTAQQAGMVLTPAGFVFVLCLPIVGTLVSKTDARFVVMFGFGVVSASLFYMARKIHMQMDFWTAVKLRCIWSGGMAFVFVPVQTLCFSGVPRDQSNQVSAIMNLSRNMGGGFGIALVTTLIAIRAQVHQSRLALHTTAYDPVYTTELRGLAQSIVHVGASEFEAGRRAAALFYQQLVAQATQLAYLDALWVLAVATAAMIPAALLTRRPLTAQGRGH